MILNDLEYNGNFALKSVSGSATNGLAFWLSYKTVLKFAELCIYCQRQKCSAGTLVTGDISSNGVIHWGSAKRGRRIVFTALTHAVN